MPRKILITLVLFAAVAVVIIRTFPPSALPANAPASEFSAYRAVEAINAIAQSPRLVGSPAYESARDYLIAQLKALGLTVEIQSTTIDGVAVENILGRIKGTSSSEAILLMAHLDSMPTSPGATDDASGVATILETVRVLQAEPPLDNTIIVLFTGPEENCCYGARAFAFQHSWANDVHLVVNVDAGGLSGPSILASTGPDSGWLIREMAGALPDPVGSSAVEALGNPATDYTLELRKDGFIGFDFNLAWDKRIHSPLDNVDNINLASLQHQGEHMLAVVNHFGNLTLDFPKEPRPIYFDILSLTTVYYPTSWAIPFFLAVTLVMGGTLFLGFRRNILTLRGIALGTLALLLSMLTTPLILIIIELVIIRAIPASGAPGWITGLTGESLLSNSIRWGSVVLALMNTYLWFTFFRKVKRLDCDDLVVGSYLLLYLTAFGTSVLSPALSYFFVWPLLFALAAASLHFLSKGKARIRDWLQLSGMLGSAVIAIVLFLPMILLALFAIDIRMIFLVPVFVVALFGFLVAPLEILIDKKRGGTFAVCTQRLSYGKR
jgi:hypothetical protein